MQEQQNSPRVGDDPLPGHWAAGISGFDGAGGLAHGFDCLAEQAGLADGLSLLLKTCGITIGQVQEAVPAQLREWFYACYAGHSGKPMLGAWDVVAVGSGIYSYDSGWCPPASR